MNKCFTIIQRGMIVLLFFAAFILGFQNGLYAQCNPEGGGPFADPNQTGPGRYEFSITPTSSYNLMGQQFCNAVNPNGPCCSPPAPGSNRCLDLIFKVSAPSGSFTQACTGEMTVMTAQGNFDAAYLNINGSNTNGGTVNCNTGVGIGNNYIISAKFFGQANGDVMIVLTIKDNNGMVVGSLSQTVPVANFPGYGIITICKPGNGCVEDDFVFGCCNIQSSIALNAGSPAAICEGASTTLKFSADGGTPPYMVSYLVSDGVNMSNESITIGTNGGPAMAMGTLVVSPTATTTYTILSVKDATDCAKPPGGNAAVTVTVHPAVTASATATDALCNGGNGKITMTMGGGTSPFDIDWSGPVSGSTLNKTSGHMIINLPAGVYNLTVTDEQGCTKTTSAAVGQPAVLTATANPTDVTCPGETNGKITMTIGGGTSPYDIAWDGPGANDGTANNQASGYMITGLPAGSYSITVTDDHNCTKTTSATVGTANPTPTCTISDGMGAVCPNSTGNQYTATAGMDSYLWSISGNGSIPGSKTGPSAAVTAGASGTYTVSVTITKNGCSSSCTKTVNISIIPFMIVSTSTYCEDDPGPVIGLNGSENGAMYQLQTGGGANLGAPVAGTGAPIIFGSYPNGNYKVHITGGTCDATLQAAVNGTATGCRIDVPNYCACNAPNGRAEVTIKITAPFGQNWQVVEVIGLYGPMAPYNPITPGTPLTFMGMGMYKLEATRDNLKGFFVKVSNGFTEKQIQVGDPSW